MSSADKLTNLKIIGWRRECDVRHRWHWLLCVRILLLEWIDNGCWWRCICSYCCAIHRLPLGGDVNFTIFLVYVIVHVHIYRYKDCIFNCWGCYFSEIYEHIIIFLCSLSLPMVSDVLHCCKYLSFVIMIVNIHYMLFYEFFYCTW